MRTLRTFSRWEFLKSLQSRDLIFYCLWLYLATCSPTWRRRDNMHSFGGVPIWTPSCSSEAGCLSCCVVDPHCTAVDVVMTSYPALCYIYTWPDAVRIRAHLQGVNQFELVSRGDCITQSCKSIFSIFKRELYATVLFFGLFVA